MDDFVYTPKIEFTEQDQSLGLVNYSDEVRVNTFSEKWTSIFAQQIGLDSL